MSQDTKDAVSPQVDKFCAMEAARVYDNYSCCLEVDSKFYVIQILIDEHNMVYFYTRYGAKDKIGMGDCKRCGIDNYTAAIALFNKKFFEKTKNHWKDRVNAVPPNRYCYSITDNRYPR